MADKLRVAQELATTHARHLGTLDGDSTREGWLKGVVRDGCGVQAGMAGMVVYNSIAWGETAEEAHVRLIDGMVDPLKQHRVPPPPLTQQEAQANGHH
ncbi:hypothetical protein PYCC9005_000393 [Savitreella phatthalungensis]